MKFVEMSDAERDRYQDYVMKMLADASILMCPTDYIKDESGFVEQHLLVKLTGTEYPIVGLAEIEIPWCWIDNESSGDDDGDDYDGEGNDDDNNSEYLGDLPTGLWDQPNLWDKIGWNFL